MNILDSLDQWAKKHPVMKWPLYLAVFGVSYIVVRLLVGGKLITPGWLS